MRFLLELSLYALGLVLIVVTGAIVWMAPPGELDPFCTYDSQYELTASLRVGTELLHSTVRTQNSRSRRWIATLNGGCQRSHGRALSFLSSDGRAFLIPTLICPLAEEVLLDVDKVDVLRMCRNRWPNKAIGFIVTTASEPQSWQAFDFSKDGETSLVAMQATSYRWGAPSDDIDTTLPSFRNTVFETGSNWWYSPNRILRRPDTILHTARKLPTELK